MSRNKKTRNLKNWKHHFSKFVTPDMPAYWHHFDLRPIDDLDDDGLEYAIT
jgi:hypothetical protein